MNIYDKFLLKYRLFTDPLLGNFRSKKLNNTNFTIISNNCWGGHVYRRFNLPYSSPTIGLYFFASDYIKFIKNLKHYIHADLTFIDYTESHNKNLIIEKKQENSIIGLIDDIEIMFLHYKSREEAKQKWNRRKARINFNNLIVKFSNQNNCTEEDLFQFDQLNYKKKFFFYNKQSKIFQSSVFYNGYKSRQEMGEDVVHYNKYIDIVKLINQGEL